jgi:hypothetical protein
VRERLPHFVVLEVEVFAGADASVAEDHQGVFDKRWFLGRLRDK